MVASRFAIFSLSSDGLMTTAFPAERTESGPRPPGGQARSPPVLCVLGGMDRRAEGTQATEAASPALCSRLDVEEEGREEGRTWALMGEQSWSQLGGLVSPDISKLRVAQCCIHSRQKVAGCGHI